jgi:hypothetical protein
MSERITNAKRRAVRIIGASGLWRRFSHHRAEFRGGAFSHGEDRAVLTRVPLRISPLSCDSPLRE